MLPASKFGDKVITFVNVKILITNTIVLNGGDAAILFGQLRILRQAFGNDTEFVIYAREPDVVARYYPNLKLQRWLYLSGGKALNIKYFRRLTGLINRIRSYFAAWCWVRGMCFITRLLLSKNELSIVSDYSTADLIAYTGGTNLVENYNLSVSIFDCNLSCIVRRPLIFLTQSLGPFRNSKNRSKFRKIFHKATLILVRGNQSVQNLKDLGTNLKNVHTAADAAFALADPVVLQHAQYRKLPRSSPLKVAISVRDWDYFVNVEKSEGMAAYMNAVRVVVNYVVEKHDAQVTFLSTCQGIPEYWKDDSKVGSEIVGTLPDSIQRSVKVNRDFHSPEELIEQLKSFDMVISTRMHIAILALIAGTPVLPIGYEFKTKEVFERIKQGVWVQDIEAISGEGLVSSIKSFIENIDELRESIFTQVELERRNAMDSGERVKEAYDHWLKLQKS